MTKLNVEPRTGTLPVTGEQRHALVLRAWEAINAERELRGVLAAVSEVLVPWVPFGGVALTTLQGFEAYAFHIVQSPDESRNVEEVWRAYAVKPLPVRPGVPLEDSDLDREHQAGRPYACADILEKNVWLPHEFRLAAVGVRAYATCPLKVLGNPVGVAVFCRDTAEPFTPQQLAVLSDISRALAVAVANAMANDEIRKLKEQLEAENSSLRTQLNQSPWFEGIVGDSMALRRALDAVEQVAATDATVMITGETGTGKELIARILHRRSPRANGPLIMVNCSAIPAALLASELFGHERGAFTGAVNQRKGRFEQAHGGTLFLDEVAEMPLETQVLLLRVLQQREFERLGGGQTLRVDVRIVAATNRDLAERVRAGHFRDDLFYRLNIFPIRMPTLRERREDISLLVAHFADKHGPRFGRRITRIDRRTLKLLESYDWPGNVRELENVVERAVILSRNGTLRIERETLQGTVATGDLDAHLKSGEREMIEAALKASDGRVSGPNGAARRLGLAPSTLDYRIMRLGIDKFRFRTGSAKQ
ncbi:MAG TPA: sigma 54-interacting transcriptional regulator [Blastocatellia bacterium]|nr:sigma 54-interacting transcriptional regulator [Blastocatellia bacterium]